VDRDVAIIKQSSPPQSSVNLYDEFNINAFDAIIGHVSTPRCPRAVQLPGASPYRARPLIWFSGTGSAVRLPHRRRRANPVSAYRESTPGLSLRNCIACQVQPEYACSGLRVDLPDQHTVLVASVPLDDEGWEPLPEGTAVAVKNGAEVQRISTR